MQAGSPLRTSPARLRRRPISQVLEQQGSHSAARKGPDISHVIGFGILLTAALFIAIGSFGVPTRSGGAIAATEAGSFAIGSHGQRR